MTNRLEIAIPQAEANQLTQAAITINKVEGIRPFTGCIVELSERIHKEPGMQYVIIKYSDNQVFFDLAKTFGIILQKVNPQPL